MGFKMAILKIHADASKSLLKPLETNVIPQLTDIDKKERTMTHYVSTAICIGYNSSNIMMLIFVWVLKRYP